MNAVDNLWKLIAAGDLLSSERLLELQSEYIRNPPGQDLLGWLISRKEITEYQAKVFAAGHSGPFHYADYVVVDRITDGEFEGGFRARHEGTGHPVILSFVSGENLSARWLHLRRTAIASTLFSSPWIIRCFEAVETDDFKFLVMEDFPGKPLAKVLAKSGSVKPKTACDIIRRVGLGLQTMHQTGYAHGHISSRNVRLGADKAIKLFFDPEFQFVPLVRAHSKPDPVSLNLVDYAAPELADPHGQPDILTDIYALGCLFYELLAGKPPFAIGSVQERMQQHATQRVKPLENLGYDKKLAQFVYFMLAKDRQLRFQSLADVLQQLDSLPDSGTPKPSPPARPSTFAEFDRSIRAENAENIAAFAAPPASTPASLQLVPPTASAASTPPATNDRVDATPSSPATSSPAPSSPASPPDSSAPAAGPGKMLNEPARSPTIATTKTEQGVATAPATKPDSKLGLSVSDDEASTTRSFRSRQKSSLKKTLIPVGITLLVLAIPATFFWVKYGDQMFSQTASADPDADDSQQVATGEGDGQSDGETAGEDNDADPNELLVEDDQRTLWESPTAGTPIDFELLPIGMRMALLVRGADLFANDTEGLIAKSLGPDFASQIQKFETLTGISWKEAAALRLSIHDNNTESGNGLLAALLVEPVDQKPLVYWLAKWGDCTKQEHPDGNYYTSTNGWAYYSPGTEDQVDRFLVAPESLVKDLIENGEGLLSTGLNRLLPETDASRHINVVLVPADLFSPSGKSLFQDPWHKLLGLMSWFMGGEDRIQAVSFSVHLVEGAAYLESQLAPHLGTEPPTLAEELRVRIAASPTLVDDYMLDVNADRHWKKVAREIPDWVESLARMSRVGVESKMALVNCWQEDIAVHNLLAGLEYTFSFAEGSAGPIAPPVETRKTPQTIEELLATVRTIEIANDDLNIAVDKIEAEIKDDYPTLPFDFKIEINGQHLMDDGITKNQRLVDFKVENKPLGDILAEFVFRANTDKTSTGPSDPRTLLIWVILNPDPNDPKQKSVLITTRKAATREGYTLPKQFIPQ